MQILPTSTSNSTAGFFSAVNENSLSNFFEAMQSAMDAVDNGESVSAQSDLETNAPLVESPYTRHTDDGVYYTVDEVCFTKSELLELRETLIKEGAPIENLSQFNILADQPNGATLAQVMASLTGTNKQVNITGEDEHEITAFLGQIDPSGVLAGDVLTLMRNGMGLEALDLIQNALAKMEIDQGITVDAVSMGALGRGLGLNNANLNNLTKIFENSAPVVVNADQMDALLDPAKNQFVTNAANSDKLNAALEKTLKPIISKARARMEKEKAANALRNRRVEQSRVLIDKTVQKHARKTIDDTVGVDHSIKPHRENDEQINYLNKDNKFNQDQFGDKFQFENNTHTYANERQEQNAHFDPLKQELNYNFATKPINTNDRKNLTNLDIKSPLASKLQNSTAFNLFANETKNTIIPTATSNANVADQVQQVLMSANRDGSRRIDLQLSPVELGSIAVTMNTRNGNTSATLQVEKKETADILNRQIVELKQSLENQGIHFGRIKVVMDDQQNNMQNSLNGGNQSETKTKIANRSAVNKKENISSKFAQMETDASQIMFSTWQDAILNDFSFLGSMPNVNRGYLGQGIANQVQQSLLTAMRDGSTRIDLQLHPAELGALAITLIAQDGEITAQIKSENSETVEVVNRQIETIRQNLEGQGVKIDKIEVIHEEKHEQMQDTFQDLNQHNSRQEEDSRQQVLTRLRNLVSLRNNRENETDTVLEHSLHNIAKAAIYAGHALNVVA